MDKKLFRDLSYGMFVLSTNYKNRKVGCFVNTVVQITSENPVIVVSVNKNNFTNEAIKSAKQFVVNVLSTNTNPEVIGKFGFFSSREVDKFKQFNITQYGELPVVSENMCGYFVCELINVVSVDTHDIFIARVLDAVKQNNFEPMTYAYYHKVIKGSAPKTAPTFVEEQPQSNVASKAKKYKCTICGYIYDDAVEKIKFADLPENWVCPLCGAPKNCFELVEE